MSPGAGGAAGTGGETSTRTSFEYEVTVDRVEQAFDELWGQMGEEEVNDQPHLRVCTMNLLVAGASGVPHQDLLRQLTLVLEEHPARLIVVSDENPCGVDGPISVRISATCRMSHAGDARVCSEELLLCTGGAGQAQLRSGIITLLLPGVPSYLWWAGESPNDRLVELSQHVDEIIFDSAALGTPSLSAMDGLGERSSLPVNDLAWGRALPWRVATSQLFDPAERRELLPRIEEVGILHGSGGRTLALLYSGWLAARLGWKLESGYGDEDLYFISASGHRIRSRMALSDEVGSDPRHMVSVIFAFRDGGRASITRSSIGDCAVTLCDAPSIDKAHRVVALDLPGVPELLIRVLEDPGVDEFYLESKALIEAARSS